MWIAAAVLTFAATFAGALVALQLVRRRPFALDALLAFGLTVAMEALALNVLSIFGAVTRPGVLAAHAVALACLTIVFARAAPPGSLAAAARRAHRSLSAMGPPALLVIPVFALVATSALRYAPNNWDSMTYHLARVAHWIQQRSVGIYPTYVDRQLVLMPGAEYVLATLQVISGTDRLANFVQLAAWLLVVLASPPLARIAGAPRSVAPWAAVIAASLPMGVLQASSTQNDLVAAALALGVWTACTPFLNGRLGAWKPRDAILLAAVLSAASIVKASALVAAAPVLAVAATRTLRGVVRGGGARKVAAALAASALVVAIVVGPEIARRSDDAASRAMKKYSASFLYPIAGDFQDRALNLGRGVARHVPLPRGVVSASGVDPDSWCSSDDALCGRVLSRAHEDLAGNPFHVAICAVAAVLLALRWRRVPARTRLFLPAVAASWVLFHVTFKDNIWISRLETPTFVLVGLAVASLGHASRWELRWARPATAAVALAALVYATAVAAQNETRPPFTGDSGPRDATYYTNQPYTRVPHDIALSAARELRCSRLGLVIGTDSYDYPLTWRAMSSGVQVRHVFGDDPWPCLVFAEYLPAPIEALHWLPTSVPFLFLNASAPEATAAATSSR